MTPAARFAPLEPESDSASRERVIEAAIECIVERGFYRASTNLIARKAGMTWGVIQHHFGNREGLMLAVIEHGIDQLREILTGSTIEGVTIQERLESFASIMARYYSTSRYLALLQVQLNLMADPTTSAEATHDLATMNRMTGPMIDALTEQVFEGAVQPGPEYRLLLFFAVRGLEMSRAVNESLPEKARVAQAPVDWDLMEKLLMQGLDAVYKDLAVKGASRHRK